MCHFSIVFQSLLAVPFAFGLFLGAVWSLSWPHLAFSVSALAELLSFPLWYFTVPSQMCCLGFPSLSGCSQPSLQLSDAGLSQPTALPAGTGSVQGSQDFSCMLNWTRLFSYLITEWCWSGIFPLCIVPEGTRHALGMDLSRLGFSSGAPQASHWKASPTSVLLLWPLLSFPGSLFSRTRGCWRGSVGWPPPQPPIPCVSPSMALTLAASVSITFHLGVIGQLANTAGRLSQGSAGPWRSWSSEKQWPGAWCRSACTCGTLQPPNTPICPQCRHRHRPALLAGAACNTLSIFSPVLFKSSLWATS